MAKPQYVILDLFGANIWLVRKDDSINQVEMYKRHKGNDLKIEVHLRQNETLYLGVFFFFEAIVRVLPESSERNAFVTLLCFASLVQAERRQFGLLSRALDFPHKHSIKDV